MKKTNHGTDIIASAINRKLDCKVVLLRKTNKAGEIRHYVSVIDHKTGNAVRFPSTSGIAQSFAKFKAMANA